MDKRKRHNKTGHDRAWDARFKDTCNKCYEPIAPRTPVDWLAGKIVHQKCARKHKLAAPAANTEAARANAHRKARRAGRGKATAREVVAAVEIAKRNRDAILRGDTYRAGGVPEAPGATRRTRRA